MMMFEICLFYSTLQMYGIFLTLPCDWKNGDSCLEKKERLHFWNLSIQDWRNSCAAAL